MRLTEDRLVAMAFGALEEVAAVCRYQPVPRSDALRLVLAYLAARQLCERRVFDNFWRGVDHPRARDRSAVVNSALNGIYRVVGIRRQTEVMGRYEARARARFLGEDRPGNGRRVDLALTKPEGEGGAGPDAPC